MKKQEKHLLALLWMPIVPGLSKDVRFGFKYCVRFHGTDFFRSIRYFGYLFGLWEFLAGLFWMLRTEVLLIWSK